MNLYGMVGNDAVNGWDYLGLDKLKVTFCKNLNLFCVENLTTKEKCCLKATSGGWDNHEPLPNGKYTIAKNPSGDSNYFALFKNDGNINDQFYDPDANSDPKDPNNNSKGRWRDGIRLGNFNSTTDGSHGCVMCRSETGSKEDLEKNKSDWEKIQKWIRDSDSKKTLRYRNNQNPSKKDNTQYTVTTYGEIEVKDDCKKEN